MKLALILSLLLQPSAVLTADSELRTEITYSSAVQQALESRKQDPAFDLTGELKKLAGSGDDSAFQALGEVYQFGFYNIAPNGTVACDYFEAASEPAAVTLHNIATCYYQGFGRAEDLPRARDFYLAAAQAGWRQSFCAYGNMLIKAQGGEENVEEGIRLCRIASAAGDINALTDLGGYFLTGLKVDRDPFSARMMLEEAAQQEQRNAAYLLAQIYQKGDGVDQNLSASLRWFTRAYEWGRPDAAWKAGMVLARQGVDTTDG